jgi:hypothetical protein
MWLVRSSIALALLVAVALAAVGCTYGDEPDERRDALEELVVAFGLEPQPGDAAVRLGRTKSKSDYPYYTATGVLDEASREAGTSRVGATFEREGWEVLESGGSERFLGACVRARRGSMVALSSVGWSTRPESNLYQRLPGRVYVQTSVGREGSNQVWTVLDTPSC